MTHDNDISSVALVTMVLGSILFAVEYGWMAGLSVGIVVFGLWLEIHQQREHRR